MKNSLCICGLILISACGQVKNNHQLPILGHHEYQEQDTIFYTVGEFDLVNQDSAMVSHKTYEDQIVVADFFFTSCPDICPRMKAQMVRVYDKIQNDQDVTILSHTIDPEYDSVALLKRFATNLGVTNDKWQFLTGERDSIYTLAETYWVLADEDPSAPGGFVHRGAFLLVDKMRRIRGVYDGTESDQVDLLLNDIDILRKEYE